MSKENYFKIKEIFLYLLGVGLFINMDVIKISLGFIFIFLLIDSDIIEEPRALYGIINAFTSSMQIYCSTFFKENNGAFCKPINKQGKKVGVIYSAEDFASTISFVIVISSNAGECTTGTFNSLDK